MAREGEPAETWLNLEQIEEREDDVPPWPSSSSSRHLGGRGMEDDLEGGLGAPPADEGRSRHQATPLIENRDPKSVNKCLKVTFEDVIAEPASVRSCDRVWVWSHALFEVSRLWCYRLVSLLLAVPVSLLAGLLLALLSCLHIWLITPGVQLCLISMRWLQVVWASVLNVAVGPFFTSMGKCCGSISIRVARD